MPEESIANDLSSHTAGNDYLVVARRYRPQTFDELIGQQHAAGALKQAIATGRIGHAYLFTGARGVGKTSAARIFAKALNCSAADGPTPTPCNACDVCRGVSAGEDVDVIEIDGASNRGIDEIRQLRQNVAVRPSRARFKVYIIDEVHMLTKEAFNALLKTLEEPPEHVKFIFATTEPNKIPITILSRCQRFDFAGIESQNIQTRLKQIAEAEGIAIDDEALQILALRAAGSMRDGQSLLEQLLAVSGEAITAHEVNSLLGIAPAQRIGGLAKLLVDRDAAGALEELDGAIDGGADVGLLIDQLLGYFRDVMTLTVGGKPEGLLYALPAQAVEAAELGQQLGLHTVLAILQVLDQTAARLRVSVHSRTLAEMAIVRICSLEDLDDLAGLIAGVRDGSPTGGGAPTQRPAAPRPAAVRPASPTQTGPTQAAPSQGNQSPASASTPTHSPAPASQPPQASLAESMAAQRASKPVVNEPVAKPPAPTPIVNATPPPASDQTNGKPSSGGLSLSEQLNAQLSTPQASHSAPAAPRKSRRQQLAEIAEEPFVKKAMDLFDVEPDKLRYTPPK